MKPVLFKTKMVRAILEGLKMVMRRAVKPQSRVIYNDEKLYDYDGLYAIAENQNGGLEQIDLSSRPRDILYVRETWTSIRFENWFEVTFHTKYWYSADDMLNDPDEKWRPSIHMPREAAHIFLRVREVRVERLQGITEEQAKHDRDGIGGGE